MQTSPSIRRVLLPTFVSCVGMVACDDRGSVGLVGETDTGEADSAVDSDSGAASCVGQVDTILPADQADGITPGLVVRVDFLDAPVQREVSIRLRADNSELPGRVDWSEDGLTATFVPLQTVPSDTPHEVRVSGDCGDVVSTFTTGAPTWRLGFGSTTMVKPASGPDLGAAFGTVLVRLDAASETALDLVVAPAKGGSQDGCGVTSDGRATRDDDGVVEISFGLAQIVVDDAPVDVGDLRLLASLDASTERLGDVTLAARVPVGPMESALGRNSGTLCGTGPDQVLCLPCPPAIGGTCVRVEFDDLTSGVSSATVERIGPGQVPGTCSN